MANGGQIKFGIGFNVDKTSLNQLRTEFQQIANLTNKSVSLKGMSNIKGDLVDIRQTALTVDRALEAAFNQQLGTINVSKFNAELKKSGLTMKTVHTDLSKLGTRGQQAFRNLSTQVLTTNRQLKQTHNTLDKMASTMGNTIKWGVTSSIMNNFTGSVRKAYGYVKKLDTSLNDIRIVTNKSAAEMKKFAESANKAAKSLGAGTTEYTDAALIYYQQGLKDKEVEARAETTLKAANVTGQTGQEVSEQLTAVWNGYKVSAEETELYVDKLAAVAATTASDLEELSTGMEKVASAANAMGVDIDQLNGHLSTVISVTRQAPESAGTAFKTIYARLGDLAVGKEDEFGVKLGDVSGKLKKMGIEILDQNGNMRDMGTVIEEVAEKWDGWTSSQREAAAVAMAGKRQYNNLIALFDNWDMYTEAVETSANAMGTLQNQQDIYMESADAHVQIMRTSFEDLYDSLLDEETIIAVTDKITKVVEKMTSFVDAIGGGGNTLLTFGSIATRVFSKNIAQGLATTITNMQAVKYNASQVKAEFEVLQQFKGIPISGALKEIVGWKQQILNLGKTVTNEQNSEANAIMRQRNELELLQEEWVESKTAAEQYLNRVKDGRVKIDTNNMSTDKDNDIGYANYEKATGAIKKYLSTLEEKETGVKEAEKALKNYRAAMNGTAAEEETEEQAQEKVAAAMKATIDSMKTLAKDTKIGEQAQEELNKALNKFKTSSKTFKDNEELVAKFKQILKEAGIEGKNALDTVEKEASGFSDTFKQQIEDCQKKWREFTQNLRTVHFIKSFITMTSAVGNLASAYQSLSNISKIANDESLSASERTTQIIMAVSMGISMLSMGISGLSQGLVGMGSVLGLSSIAVDAFGNKLTEEGLKAAIASKQNITYQKSLFGVSATAKTATGAMLKLIAAFSPYIAILALLGGALYVAIKNFEKEAKAAEKAQKTADELVKSHARLQNEIGKVNEAIQTLKDNEDALKGLEKGTEAWNQKLKESNEYVLELLDKYPQLGNHIFTDENGLLRVSDKGLNDLKDLKAEEEQNSRIAASAGSIEANEKQIIANEVKVQRELYYIGEKDSPSSYQKTNRYDKGGNSTKVNKSNAGFEKIEISDEAFEKVLAVVEEKGSSTTQEDILNAVGGNESLTEKIVNKLPDIVDLLSKNNALLAGNKIHEDQIVDKIIKKANLDSEDEKTKGLKGAAGDAYDQAYDNELAKVEKLNRKNLIDEYLKSNSGLSIGKEGSGRDAATFLDSEGNEVPVSLAAMQSHVASTRAQKIVEGKLDTIIEQLKAINSSDFAKDFDFSGNIGQSFTSGDKDKGFNLESLSDGDILKLVNNPEAIKGDLENLIDDDYAISKGYDTAALYVDAFFKEVEKRAAGLKSSEVEEDWLDDLRYSKKGEGFVNKDNKKIDLNVKDWDRTWDPNTAYDMSPQEVSQLSQDEINKGKAAQQEVVHTAWTYDDKETEAVLTEGGYTEKDFHNKASEYYKNIADSENITNKDGNLYDIEEIKKVEKAVKNLKEKGWDELNKSEKELIKQNPRLVNMMKIQGEEVEDVTTDFFKMNIGYQSTLDNYKKWDAGLKKGKGAPEYVESLDGIRTAMSNILGVSPDFIQETSLTQENLKLMKEAAEGDETALWKLRKATADDYLVSFVHDKTALETARTQVSELFSLVENTKPGMDIDTGQFIAKIKNLKETTGMSISQIMKLISQMGIQPKISWEDVSFKWPSILNKDKVKEVKLPFKVPKVTFSGKVKDGGSIATTPDVGSGDVQTTNVEPSDSGGGKSKPKKSYNITEKKRDPYYNVNNKLKKYATEFERLANAQDRLYGKDLKNNLNEQLKIIKKQISATKEKLKIARQEAAEMRKSVKNQRKGYYNDLKDFGIKFNKNGEITNYDSVMKKWDKKVRELDDKWNKMTAEQQESDAGKILEKQIEKAKANRDMLAQLVEEYGTLIYDTIPGLMDDNTEFAYQQMEIRLAKFNIEAEVKLDLSEAIKQWEDFKRNIIELKLYDDLGVSNSLEAEAEKLSKVQNVIKNSIEESINTGLIKTLKENLDDLLEEQEKIDKNPKSYKGQFASRDKDGNIIKDKNGNVVIDEKALKEAIDQKKEELEDAIIDLRELEKEALENILQGIDLIDQSYDKEVELLEHIEKQAQHELDMIKLINGEGAYDKMAGSYEQMAESAEKVAEARKREMDYYREQMNRTDITEEEREKFRELYLQSAEDYQAALQHHAEILKKEFSNYVQSEIQTLKDYLGFDKNKAIWELEMEMSDDYLDEVESAFGTQSFINKVQESINKTDSPAAQKKLNDLLDKELAKLREKDKLTQYDLDRANAMYELELKKIALEEAQQNKSKMRLRRDASGNYSYQFVADENAENKAQEELLKAQNDLYKLDKKEAKKNYE